MKIGFYPKMAVSGIRKNGRLYLPYIVACILMVAVFYIMHLLGFSKMLETAVLLWEKDPEFRKKTSRQLYFCLPHYKRFLETASSYLSKKMFKELTE